MYDDLTDVEDRPDWADITCPEGCYPYQPDEMTTSCVCPATSNSPPVDIRSTCNPTIEVCEEVRQVTVPIGFSYKPSAETWWGIFAVTMVAYASMIGLPFDTSTNLGSAWIYNFAATMATWGV